MQRRACPRSGFHLLEVTTAIFVVTAGAFGAITLLQQGLSHIRETQEHLIANQIVVNEMETARAIVMNGKATPPFVSLGNPHGRNARRAIHQDAPGMDRLRNAVGRVEVRAREDLGAGLHEIDVTLRWSGNRGRTLEKRLTTLAETGEFAP